MTQIDGKWYYTREELEQNGFTYSGITVENGNSSGAMRKALIKLDLAYGSLQAFRIADDHWEYYLTKNTKNGFEDLPLLV